MKFLIISLAFLCAHARTVSKLAAGDVTNQLNELVHLDENSGNMDEVNVNFQNMASHTHFDHDNAKSPLFTSVSEYVIAGPTMKSFEKLVGTYTLCEADVADPNTPERTAAINEFLSTILETKVMQATWSFLSKAQLASSDAESFKKQLFNMWFTPYARGAAEGSSGFESVFVGETLHNEVYGLSYWYQFYLLEKANKVNYHGWFTRQKGVQLELQFAYGANEAIIDSFLLGTSPEFDLAVYTICALANVGDCKYTNEGNGVNINVKTLTVGAQVVIDSVYPSSDGGATPTKGPGPGPKTTRKPMPVDKKLQELVDAMRAADEDKPVDYKLNWGNARAGTTDTSPDPLFTYVNEAIFQRPIYKALIDVYNNDVFIPDVCNAEGEITGNRKVYIDTVFDAFTSTKVFQLALAHLQELGVAGDWETFKKELYTLWFGRYTRCSGALGSSGWEHVFIGEWKATKVDGQHSWVKYYHLEKAGDINYHGYLSYDEQLTGTFQYTWGKYLKNVGGFNTGTSPAFDFSLFSVCALTTSGKNSCKFNIDNFPIMVTSFTQACEGGKCLSTVYPANS